MNIVFLGPPGAGKGTQAQSIKDKYQVAHISTGDMLRAAIAAGTPMGLKAAELMNKGALVSDDIVIGIVEDRLKEDDCKKGYLLDGFPRTLPQAQSLQNITKLDAVVLLDVDAELLVKRITGRRVCPACKATWHVSHLESDKCPTCGAQLVQRADDNEETVRSRMKAYTEQTAPLVDFYSELGLLKKVNGMQDIDKVFADICAVLDEL